MRVVYGLWNLPLSLAYYLSQILFNRWKILKSQVHVARTKLFAQYWLNFSSSKNT